MKTFIGVAVIASALMSWQPNAHATTMFAGDVEGQPLTRAACDMAQFAWNDEGNVCDWPVERAISTAEPEITGAITSSQPLTRATCDRAGLAWDDNGNVCDWTTKWTTPSPSLEITSKPQRTNKQSTQVNGHTKRKYTHRSPRKTQVVERRPFALFQLFRN